MNQPILSLFALAAILQLAVPIRLAWQAEATLRTGEPVKFPLVLRDPHDPMRGKYVQLSYDWGSFTLPAEFELRRGGRSLVCAAVAVDEAGFGTISGISLEPPPDGLWFRVEARRGWDNQLWLEPTFDRFFLHEDEAKDAEEQFEAYLRTERPDATGAAPAYALVRLRAGIAQLENVYLGDRPLGEIAREPGD